MTLSRTERRTIEALVKKLENYIVLDKDSWKPVQVDNYLKGFAAVKNLLRTR